MQITLGKCLPFSKMGREDTFELADRVRMVMRLGRPLCGGALVQQDGPNELIASLYGIVKV